MVGASLTIILLIIVNVLTGIETVSRGQSQISAVNLNIFNIGALVAAVWLGWLTSLEKLGDLLGLLATVTGLGAVDGRPEAQSGDDDTQKCVQRTFTNPWVPVTFQFLLVGWLIYASGGLMNSAYAQVPVVMMVIGQSVYDTPVVVFSRQARMLDVIRFLRGLISHYWYPILILMCLLVGLMVLQAQHPLVRRPAPDWEMAFTTLVGLLVSMCVVFVTRRADQATARGAD